MLRSAVWGLVLAIGSTPNAGFAEKAASARTHSSNLSSPKLPPSKVAPSTAPPPEIKPYDPQLMRLAEMLGALSYLRGLCGGSDAATWQMRMQALLEAEGTTQNRRERLAGAYNRGIAGYELSYRTCTPNAQTVIERFLEEAAAIAKDVENHFGAT